MSFKNLSFYGYLKNRSAIVADLDKRLVGFFVEVVEDEDGEPSLVVSKLQHGRAPFSVRYRIGFCMDSFQLSKKQARYRFDKAANRIVSPDEFPLKSFVPYFNGLFEGEVGDHVVTMVVDDFADYLDAREAAERHAQDLHEATLVEQVVAARAAVAEARAALAEAEERLKGAERDLQALDVARDMRSLS